MKNLIGILALAVLTIILCAGCSNRAELSEISDISSDAEKIEIKYFSCIGEREFSIDRQEDIAEITGWISEMELAKRTFKDGEAPNDMEGGESFALEFYNDGDPSSGFIYLNSGTNHYVMDDNLWYEVKNPGIPEILTLSATGEKALLDDLIPMVCVEGRIYLDTGRESDIEARCGVVDGEITSSVPPSEKPTADDQSNFGAGLEYQFVDEKSLDIYMNGKWFRFQTGK